MSTRSIHAERAAHTEEAPSAAPVPDEPQHLRGILFAALLDTNRPGNMQQRFDNFTAMLIVANLLALLFEHVPAIYEPNAGLFHAFDMFSLAVFTIEYLMRLYTAPELPEFAGKRFARLRWASSPMSLIDLAAILPFYLAAFVDLDLRALRALRLLRLLKLTRVIVPAVREFRERNAGRTFRQKVHALFFMTPYSGKLHGLLDTFLVIWVLVSVLAVILETVHSIHDVLAFEFKVVDTIAVALFTIEYAARIYSAPEEDEFKHRYAFVARLRYGRTPGALIDLLAILPFFLELFLHHLFDLRFLRVFRLLRLLKLTRYTGAMGTLLKVVRREWRVLYASGFVMILLVILTASFGYLLEHEAQPDKFENIPASIYWAVVTLASVGYGDISPVTPAGRAMTVVLAFLGIGIFAIPAGLLASAFTDQLRLDRENFEQDVRAALADGHISKEEREMIEAEASRLHLSKEDVDRIIKKVRHERATERAAERERKHEQQARQSTRHTIEHAVEHAVEHAIEHAFEHAIGHDHGLPVAGPATLPIDKLAQQPELAFEQARVLIGQLRMLGAATDTAKIEAMFAHPGRATDQEYRIWQAVTRRIA